MEKFTVHKKIRLNAPADVVWDALTNPEKTKEYFFHCRVFSDWKPGSSITFKGKMFFIIPIQLDGKIIAAEPARLLQYELINKNGSKSIVTDTLTSEGAATILTIEDNVGDGQGAQKRYDRSMKGWDNILQGLKKMVEEK